MPDLFSELVDQSSNFGTSECNLESDRISGPKSDNHKEIARDSIVLSLSCSTSKFDGSYNIAPTATGVIIYMKSNSKSEYVAEALKFGLLPEWSKPLKNLSGAKSSSCTKEVHSSQSKLFNCRRETLAQPKTVWTQPRARKRCVVPISGYFEWKTLKNGEKTPYYVHSDQKLLFLAGLYSHNSNYNDTELVQSSQDFFSSFSIVTGPADGEGKNDLKWLHSRKPIFIHRFSKEWFNWLDPLKGWNDSLLNCLQTDNNSVYDKLKWHVVDSAVGLYRNNNPRVIEEVKAKQLSIMQFLSPRKRTKEEEVTSTHHSGLEDFRRPIPKRAKIEYQGFKSNLREDEDGEEEKKS